MKKIIKTKEGYIATEDIIKGELLEIENNKEDAIVEKTLSMNKQQKKDVALKEYEAIKESAWKEYEAIREPALKKYEAIQEPAWKEYEAKCKKIDEE